MIAWKIIKPKKMKVDALRLALLNELRAVGKDVKQDFESTTRTWEHKPKFEISISLTAPGPILEVSTSDEIYRYVNKGTRRHLIWAGAYTGKSDKKVLAFPSASTSKTTPRVIGSGPGSRSSDKVIRPYVDHPGTKARNFDEEIAKKWKKLFKRRMEAVMKKGARASGHAI